LNKHLFTYKGIFEHVKSNIAEGVIMASSSELPGVVCGAFTT